MQSYGSFQRLLEERGPEGCLIDLVDDATSTTWAQAGEQETVWKVVDALRARIEQYGMPLFETCEFCCTGTSFRVMARDL